VKAQILLDRLNKVRPTGPRRWVASCPSHVDKSPSLSIQERDDGVVLLHCFAGCDPDAVVGAVGLSLSDLFPPKEPQYGRTHYRAPFDALAAIHACAHELNVAVFIASDFAQQLDIEQQERLLKVAARVNKMLELAGDAR
jgi:hypothetical protein